MSTEKFKGRYQVADGYAGGSRPQYFSIQAGDLEGDMEDAELEDFYAEAAEDHMRERITAECERVAEFVEWAKAQLAARKEAA